jgi:hypothetical protein
VVSGLRIARIDPVDAFGRSPVPFNLFRTRFGTRTEGDGISGKFLPVSERHQETIRFIDKDAVRLQGGGCLGWHLSRGKAGGGLCQGKGRSGCGRHEKRDGCQQAHHKSFSAP